MLDIHQKKYEKLVAEVDQELKEEDIKEAKEYIKKRQKEIRAAESFIVKMNKAEKGEFLPITNWEAVQILWAGTITFALILIIKEIL